MIYYFTVPKGLEDDFEFDGEYANCCSVCRLNGCLHVDTNPLGVYYDPPSNCDSLPDCQRWYDLYVKDIRPLHSKWDTKRIG